jgi:hypothetical protein
MTAPVRSTFTSAGSVQQVFDVLTSADWVATKAQRFGDGSLVKDREERPDGGLLLAVSRTLPDGVPGFLQKFLPSDGRVLETFEWDADGGDGTRTGRWHAVIPGAPARLGGTMRLEPTASGSTYTITGEVKVKVPLIGGKAESFIADMVQQLAAKEADLLIGQVEAGS